MSADTAVGLTVGLLCCLLVVAVPLALPAYAVILGFRRRRATLHRLATREPQLAHLLQLSTEVPAHPGPTTLVFGSTAYAADFPSRQAMIWRGLAGGHARSLTDQVDMARRLATMRMLEHAAAQEAVGVANIRIETSHIDMSSGSRGRQSMVIDLLVYGTALLPARDAGRARPPAPTQARP